MNANSQSLSYSLIGLFLLLCSVQSVKSQPVTRFVLTDEQQNVSIPIFVDNSQSDALPPVYSQIYFPNCEQASSIYHGFAYEYNNLMHLSGKDTSNQYPANFAYNFYNQNTQQGVSFFDTFKILFEAGQANHREFGLDHSVGGLHWMTGEANWESAMRRRVEKLYSFDVTTMSGAETLKHWLFNHGNGSSYGGVAVFTFGVTASFIPLADSCPLNHIPCLKSFGLSYSHAMLIVGYHDSTFFDLNNDGKITTDIDLNNDGIIDLRDSEYGSWIALNSYGTEWGYQGLVQLPYCLSATKYPEFGFSNGEVYGMVCRHSEPSMTLTFNLNYNQRDKLSLKVGYNEDLDAEWPDKIIDIAILNNVGGAHFMQGNDQAQSERSIEMAADISSLYSRMPAGKQVKLFLLLDENDPESQGSGSLGAWRVKENGVIIGRNDEITPILNNSITISSIIIGCSTSSSLEVISDSVIPVIANTTKVINMQAMGGIEPYYWSLKPDYSVRYSNDGTLPSPKTFMQPIALNEMVRRVELPFQFPFMGEVRDSIFVWANGLITFSESDYPYAYVQDVKNLFSKRACLVSGYCSDYRDSFETQDSIFYSVSDSSYSIIWKLPSNNLSVNRYSGITLFPDGSVVFIRPIVSFNEVGSYYQGYSSGSSDGQFIMSYHELPVSESRSLMASPLLNGMDVSISTDGSLRVKPTIQNLSLPVEVVVHDANGHRSEKLIYLTQSVSATLDWRSGRSESAEMTRVKLWNSSSNDIVNARVYLKANQSGINVAPAYIDIPFIGSNQTVVLSEDFKVQYNSSTASNESTIFLVEVINEVDTFQSRSFHKPNFINCKLLSVYVDDQVDHAIDKGELSDVVISFVNTGSGIRKGITASVSSIVDGCDIELIDEQNRYDIEPYSTHTIRCRVHLSSSFDFNLTPLVKIELTDGTNMFLNQEIELPVSRTSPLIINLAKSSVSADSLEMYMRKCGFVPRVKTLKSLSSTLSGESRVFVVTGMFGQSYALQDADIQNLNTFMFLGGKIYLEGNEFWGRVGNSTFGSYFGVTSSSGIARYDSLFGGCSITEGFKFHLSNPHPPTSFSVRTKEGTYSLLSVAGSEDKTSAFCKKDDKNVAIGSVYDIAHLVEKNKGDTKKYVQRILDLMGFDTLNMTANFYTSDRTVKVKDTVKLINCSVGSSVTPEWICQGASVIKSLGDTIWVAYSLPGSYPVKLTISNGDQSKSLQKDGYITVLSNDGVIEPIGKQYTIYPIPASNRITVSQNDELARVKRLRIYTIDGQEILRQDNLMIDRSHEIDVSTLKNGTYLLVIESEMSISSYPVVILR